MYRHEVHIFVSEKIPRNDNRGYDHQVHSRPGGADAPLCFGAYGGRCGAEEKRGADFWLGRSDDRPGCLRAPEQCEIQPDVHQGGEREHL